MDIVCSYNNNEKIMVIPIPPPTLPIEENQGNSDFEGLQGPIRLIGPKGLSKFSWSSYFPVKKSPLSRKGSSENGWEYIDFFEEIRTKQIPMRLIVIYNNRKINVAVTVDSFHWSVDRAGDIQYSIELTEYKFITPGHWELGMWWE